MHELQGNKGVPLSVFISYAHEDELLRQRLETHLSLLHRQGLISEWHDREILPGAEWNREIDEHLEASSIILLLISSDFLASDYCYEREMQRALERHKLGEARVIPIILRPCDWRTSPLARLQCLPRDGKAVTTWQNPDEAFLTIAEGLRRVIERQQIPVRPLSHVEQQNRTRLMKRVRATWIEGVLEHSLHQAALIALDLQEQPDALANPWQFEVQETNLPPHLLPVGTPLAQIYDEAEGELLILGEPGAGKTTLLLELARTLLERAEGEERHRLPVVFNLSSWARTRQSLKEWLTEELWTKYQIPRKIGQAWIDTDQVLPLLDGLDEVAEDARSACVQAINAYYQRHPEKGFVPLVVCCRSKEYAAMPTRVMLHRAVSIQPLTQDQIDRYLQSTKSQLEVLRQILQDDPELYELAHRPLMLSIFTLAYQGAALEDFPMEGASEPQQRQVFATYVERMLSRRSASKRFSRQRMMHRLAFLAAQMRQHHQTDFSLESMQPDWLQNGLQRLLYQLSVIMLIWLVSGLLGGLVGGLLGGLNGRLVSGLLVGLASGLLVGLVFGPLLGLSQIQIKVEFIQSWRRTKRNIVVGLLVGLVSGLLGGLVLGLVYGLVLGLVAGLSGVFIFGLATNQLDDRLSFTPNQRTWRSLRSGLAIGSVTGLLVGLLVGLVYGLLGGLLVGLVLGLVYGLVYGLLGGLVSWLLFGLVSWLLFDLSQMRLREVLVRLWEEMKQSPAVWLLTGICTGLASGQTSGLSSGLASGLLVGLMTVLIVGLARGLATNQLDDRLSFTPNQGIWRSLRSGLAIGSVTGLLVGLLGGLVFGVGSVVVSGLVFGLVFGPLFGLVPGLVVGLVFGLLGGLGTFLQHFALRFWLWRMNGLPWSLVAFLDKATEQLLLRKAGGGYIFIHRLLLDYFASLEKKES